MEKKWMRPLKWLALPAVCGGIFAAAFRLYHLPVAAALYPSALCALLLLAVLAATAFGSYAYLNHVAFLTVDSNNEIIVNRGLPGEVFGIQTYTLDHKTGVKTSDLDLPQNTIDRLTENGGMRVDSVADADSLVSTWKSQATSEKTQDDANEGKGGDK